MNSTEFGEKWLPSYPYPNKRVRVESVHFHERCTDVSYPWYTQWELWKERCSQTSLMLEKPHLQEASRRIYLTGNTTHYTCCCLEDHDTSFCYFISPPNNMYQNARWFYRWLVSQHTAEAKHKPDCNLAPLCSLLSTGQMGFCLPMAVCKAGKQTISIYVSDKHL